MEDYEGKVEGHMAKTLGDKKWIRVRAHKRAGVRVKGHVKSTQNAQPTQRRRRTK